MKILIADDEDYTREGLMEEIAWEEFGIDEIMQAVNGEEALKIVKWFRPDIVLSDIRMPKMDGIAFAEEMVRLIPASKLIFMSGYMETDYLKSAIRLSVIDYIEKPIDIVLVKKALRRAVDEIAREKKTREADQVNREFRQSFRSVKGRRERQLFGGIFSESGMRKPMPGGFHVEGIAVREESARRDLRGYCVWEKSGNGSEMLL